MKPLGEVMVTSRISVLLFCVVMVGCGSKSTVEFKDDSKDADAYAKNVKHLVIGSATSAKTSKEPADSLRPIVVELEQSPNRPVGSYAADYSAILAKAKEIHAACEQANGRPSGLEKQLTELTALAEKLPGEVKIAKSPD